MVLYNCLFCKFETTLKSNMKNHYNKIKKCYELDEIEKYKTIESLLNNSKINTQINNFKFKCIFCNYETDSRNNLRKHLQKNKKCYTEDDKIGFINLEEIINKSYLNKTSHDTINNNKPENKNIINNITVINIENNQYINNGNIINNIHTSNKEVINDIFHENFDHIDFEYIVKNNDMEEIFNNIFDCILDDKSNHNILIKHPNDTICQVLNTDKNGNKKLEYMPIENTYKKLMEKLGKILLPIVNKLAVKNDFSEEIMNKVCGMTLFLALVNDKRIKNIFKKKNDDNLKIGTEIKQFYQTRKNLYSCKYSNKYDEMYESIYKYIEENTNLLDDNSICDEEDEDNEDNL